MHVPPRTVAEDFAASLRVRHFVRPGMRQLPDVENVLGLHARLVHDAQQPDVIAGRNCQDAAFSATCRGGAVIAVADGVSVTRAGRSHCEVGAYLVAHTAGRYALTALERGEREPARIRRAAAEGLVDGLGGLWAVLGADAVEALTSTLLLGVVTPSWSRVWCHGDGVWGVAVGRTGQVHHIAEESAIDTRRVPYRIGGRQLAKVAGIGRYVPRGVAAVERELEEVVAADACAGLWVATDGLFDEEGLVVRLRWPVAEVGALTETLRRSRGCDDLAVAFAYQEGVRYGVE